MSNYCVIILRHIASPNCPLPKGSCVWKHGITGMCVYDAEFAQSEPTIQELASKTGVRPPSPEVALELKDALLARLKKELSK